MNSLSNSEIDQVLHMALIGRLGIIHDNKPYVVPIAYVFDCNYIYCHSKSGTKVAAMRNNKDVCFEVDIIDNLNSWRSVLVFGKYEELTNEKHRSVAVNLLRAKLNPVLISNIVNQQTKNVDPPRVVEKKQHAIYYRIKIIEKTGRFQKPYL